MNKPNPLSLKYRFEKAPLVKRPLSNAIERFGSLASQVIQTSPSLIPTLNFGRAERISDGILDPGLIAPQPKIDPQPEQVRIRCIEDSSGPLVEYFYDKNGQINEVILLNSFREKYTWSEEGKLISVVGRDSQATVFKYRNDGLLSSINYPNGSIFKYSYDETKLLSAIMYPDGIAVKYFRDAGGFVTRNECRDGAFEYVWDEKYRLQEIHYRNPFGVWGFKAGESGKKLNLEFYQSLSGLNRSVSSALGSWWYDGLGALYEMFVPSGERLKRTNVEDTEMISWAINGQTIYQFDKADTIMRNLNPDGTSTLFKRNANDKFVLFASASGIGMLLYDETGQLKVERDQNGKGATYFFGQNQQIKSINYQEQTLSMSWSPRSALTKISVGKDYQIKLDYSTFFLKKIEINTNFIANLYAIKGLITLLWNWQVLKSAHRLSDNSINRKY